MKLYRFYYKADMKDISHDIKDAGDKEEYLKNKYPLYAFTTDKKTYKEFKKDRNMDNFIITKTNIDKEDYVDYATTYRDQLLDIYVVTTRGKDGYPTEIEIPVTSYEHLVIDDFNYDYFIGEESVGVPYEIYNDKIVKALSILQYPFFYSMVHEVDDYDDSYDQPPIASDEVEILISQFYGTFE